jgi:ribosomal-protein-alanine N-acetyltransferase
LSAQLQSLHPVIRALRPEDVEDIMAIELASYPYPWTRGIFSECLRIGYGCFGLQLGSELVAYAIHNWAADEAHLLNLCVHPQHQRQGLGSLLLEHAIGHVRSHGCGVIFLEVRPSNPEAERLYRRRGFTRIGLRPAYYRAAEGREDAIVMRLELTPGD